MRRMIVPVIALGLLVGLAGVVRADEEAQKVIDKAIAAHGGPEVYAKLKGGYIKSQGKLEVMGLSLDINQEIHFAFPDKFKEIVDFEIMGNKIRTETICNGDKVSIKANGQEIPVDDKIKAAVKEAGQAMQMARLTNLKNKEYTITSLGEVKVEGKPALVIKVSAKGQKDVSLYFDKETHLLAKMQRQGIDAQGQDVDEERIFVEYKKTGKVPEIKKVLVKHDGKNFLELEILEVKNLEVVDENQFTIQ